jgi:phosphohistidine phosphatase
MLLGIFLIHSGISLNDMKTLFLVRHAKSGWDDPNIADFDRPLNERGKRDAPMMAERLHSRGIPIDVIVSSPARRAVKTAQAFAKAYGIASENVYYDDALYFADTQAFFNTIGRIEDRYHHAAIFSHNHGITTFANELRVATIDVMPTCSIFAVLSDTMNWKEFKAAPRKFWFFDYPKNPSLPEYGWSA